MSLYYIYLRRDIKDILRDVCVFLMNFHLHIGRYTFLFNNIRKTRVYIRDIFVSHRETREGYEEMGKTWETGLSH